MAGSDEAAGNGGDNDAGTRFRFHYLQDAPVVDVDAWPRLGGNANGPTLIRAPDWLPNSPGRYLLYFAHHEGASIRLAVSDDLQGPWQLHDPDPLTLADSCFALDPPGELDLDAEARKYIDAGADGYYPHIASPDAWIDQRQRRVRLYYHGRLHNGLQRTRVALSTDGLRFEAAGEVLGLPYLRIFQHGDWFYALAMPAQLYRSRDGLTGFEPGPRLTAEPIRHHALLYFEGYWYLFWTRIGDCPERILLSTLDTAGDWRHWRLGPPREVHRATRAWEGGKLAPEESRPGAVMQAVNQLRDPAIFVDEGKIYLLYAIAGERGIAIGVLEPVGPPTRQPLSSGV
ncbi:MAG TPA: hypothetical protein VKB27_09110 [Gammaproteobacteria bacterium]|nr:hypothetical protein [Gammaproteobacteria bacterium]